jgi:hypothetical protein
VDVRFDRRIIYDRFTLNVYVELVNATLSRQAYDLVPRGDGTFDEKSFRIVLPSIGVRGEF